MLRSSTLPSILPDFAAASDLSHCDFVLCAARRGKMTDGPSASASALANKIAFQALLPGASKMSERVFRGKQASWHVEFIGKLVSLDQAKMPEEEMLHWRTKRGCGSRRRNGESLSCLPLRTTRL